MFTWKFNDKEICFHQPEGVFSFDDNTNYDLPSELSLKPTVYDQRVVHEVGMSSVLLEGCTVNDHGGEGDCFFRCLKSINTFYKLTTGILPLELSTSEYYRLLELPLNTFIEDVHISKLSVMCGITVHVISEVEGKTYISQFGMMGPVYWIYNVGLFHYLSITSEEIAKDMKTRSDIGFYDFELQVDKIKAHTNYVEAVKVEQDESGSESFGSDHGDDTSGSSEGGSFSSFSQKSGVEVEGFSVEFSALVNTTDPSIIYSYLLDSNEMIFPDVQTLLDIFYHTHNLVVRSIEELNGQDKVPHPDYIKSYYKFRHNTFASICRFFMTPDELFTLETDMPLSIYLPDCKKTPDLILEDDNSIRVFEFTVGNNYERIDFYKGGGSFKIKYYDECSEISEKLKKHCSSVIVPCVLEKYNVSEVSSILNIQDGRFTQALKLFYENANQFKHIISSCHFNAESIVQKDTKLIPGLPVYKRSKTSRIIMMPADVLSALSVNYQELLIQLNNFGGSRCSIHFSLDNNKYYLKKGKDGRRASDILTGLSADFSDILTKIRFLKGKEVKSLYSFRGTVPVTINTELKVKTLPAWDYIPHVDIFYNKKVPSHVPGYGDLGVFDESSVYDLNATSEVNFPDNYFNRLCSADVTSMLKYKGSKMLYNCHMDLSVVMECVKVFDTKMSMDNAISVVKTKPTFLYPLVTEPSKPAELEDISEDLLAVYIKQGKGSYTKELASRALDKRFVVSERVKFSQELRDLFQKYHQANSNYHKKLFLINGSMSPFKSLSSDKKTILRPLLAKVNGTRLEYKSALGTGKSVKGERMIKLSCPPNGDMRVHFEKEMSHYTYKISSSGLGMHGKNEEFGSYLKSLINRLFVPNFHEAEYPKLYLPAGTTGPKFLSNLKQRFCNRFDTFYDKFFNRTLFQQLCVFNERLSKFLFNESLKTYNSDFVKVDNLGLSNVVVFCRGGPKLYKHQRSRLYKVIFSMDHRDLQYSGFLENDNFEVFLEDSKVVVCTPWSQVHQDILFDYMSMPYKSFNQIYSIYTRQFNDFTHSVPKMAVMPFILSLHNRRKTEQFMHNVRYLIVNPLGSSSNLSGIIEGFSDKNYTYLDSYLRFKISRKYVNFASALLAIRDDGSRNINKVLDKHKLTDLWLDEPIPSADMLTLFIYSTYMMTKAPVNSSLEQAGNLWGILEDVKLFQKSHSQVNGLDDYTLRFDVLNFDEKVYDDDFAYDPVFCQYLGHYMSGYLKNAFDPGELSNAWKNICESDIDVIANSNGLRGYNKSNFFSHKGYEIVYSKVDELLTDVDITKAVQEYLDMPLIDSVSKIRSDRHTCEKFKPDFKKLVFHIVHKIQRGGAREIFCMDLNTKVAQNPIERFFKIICKKVPNEFISIPSNKRHANIHSDFYERNVGKWVKQVMRWVLDCRRWAPHSVFQKFVHFVTGLSPMLPPGFIKHFNDFAEGMFLKKFLTREHVLSKMRKNLRFEAYKDIPEKFGMAADAYCFGVQFSFVMGIFNYLSTLMHAANQLVASEVIRNINLSNGNGLVILDPKCHSDDSVVSSYHESAQSVELSVKMYDWLLKGANHMLSIKKSQVNKNIYLEFLSVLYLFDRFLPVFPKFISSIPFKPSDGGLSSDLAFSVSQAIEMLSNGGTHEEAYLIMKTTASFVRKVYNIGVIDNLPPQFFGDPDSHPVELLYAGSEAEIFKMYRYNKSKFWAIFNMLKKAKLLDGTDPSFSLNWDMSATIGRKAMENLQGLDKVLEKFPNIQWTLKNNKLGNSMLNLLWYYLKLKDRKFVSSITHEPEARRYSRIFGAGSYRMVKTTDDELIPVTDVFAVIEKVEDEGSYEYNAEFDSYMNYMASQLYEFYDSLEGTEIVSLELSNLKDKPIVFKTGASHLGNVKLSGNEFVSYVKEPEAYKLLGRMSNPKYESELILDSLTTLGLSPELMSADMLYRAVRKLLSYQEKSYRLVAAVPGSSRIVENHSAVLEMIAHVSFTHTKMILKNKVAHEIDWSKKLFAGRIPENAREYMKVYWVCKTLTDYGIMNLDIFNEDLLEKEADLAGKLSDEWKIILLSTIKEKNIPLVSHNHWVYWEKEQIKMGNRWVGEGTCIVKVPECVLEINLGGGSVTSMGIHTNHQGSFSSSSSWYLNNVLKYSGVNAVFMDPTFAAPNENYLGFCSKSQAYGYGRARLFDFVIDKVYSILDPSPSDFYTPMPYNAEGSHYLFHGFERDYYIDFFVPTEDPISISFKGIFDVEKLKAHSNDDNLTKFIKKLSVDVGGLMQIDKDFMTENIGSTTLYNLIFDGPDRNKLINNLETSDYLISSFESWKKTHPDFGYPSEMDVKSLIKKTDRPPFPENVMRHLLKLGNTTITDMDFQQILIRLNSLEGEEQIFYLQNNFGFMDTEMRSNALVLAMRSKIIFSSCATIGTDALRILVPLIEVVTSTIENSKIVSKKLLNIQRTLKMSHNLNLKQSTIFFQMSVYLITQGIYQTLDLIFMPQLAEVLSVLKEMWGCGLGTHINTTPTSDPIMRTVDFNVDWETFSQWFKHLTAGHFKVNYAKIFKYGSKISRSKENIYTPVLSAVVRTMYRYDFNLPAGITLYSRKSRKGEKMYLPLETSKPGVTTVDFFIPDEESQDNFECGYKYDEDILEEVFPCPDAKRADLPEILFSSVPVLDFIGVTSQRGGAWNMYIHSYTVTREIMKIKGEKVLYRKIRRFSNLPEYLSSDNEYILYVGVDKSSKEIEGYKRLSWEQTNHLTKSFTGNESMVEIEGKKYDLNSIKKSPMLQSKISSFSQYFKKLNNLDEIKESDRVLKLIKSYSEFDHNVKLEESRKNLEKFLEAKKQAALEEERKKDPNYQGKEKVEPTLESDTTTFDQVLKKTFENRSVAEFLEQLNEAAMSVSSSKGELKQYLRNNYSAFNFKEPLAMLTDLVTRSEFNTLFPGYLDKVLNGEVALSLKTKARIVSFANGQISLMPKLLKPKYKKILLIVKAVLTEVRVCNFRESESFDFAALVDDFFVSALDTSSSEEEDVRDLLPDDIGDKIKFDLSQIL